jgi:hypothetical protein
MGTEKEGSAVSGRASLSAPLGAQTIPNKGCVDRDVTEVTRTLSGRESWRGVAGCQSGCRPSFIFMAHRELVSCPIRALEARIQKPRAILGL